LWWEKLRERDHLKDPDLDGSIILRWKYRKWDGGPWSELIWLRTQILINALMKLRVPQNGGSFLH